MQDSPTNQNSSTLSNGLKMHYVEHGAGDPLVLVHGNPTSAYLWRNIIPHLSDTHRVIAVDLPNFGRSDKSAARSYPELATDLSDFIDALELKNIAFGLHDWGGPLGFTYAARNPDNVRGIAFFETLVAPIPDFELFLSAFGPAISDKDEWRRSVVEDNFFVEQFLLNPAAGAIGTSLSELDKNVYREPFLAEESREQIAILPYEIPLIEGVGHPILDPDGPNGDPPTLHPNLGLAMEYGKFLSNSPDVSKLMLIGTPGLANPPESVPLLRSMIPDLQIQRIGSESEPGFHFLTEDLPLEVGTALSNWADTLVVPEPNTSSWSVWCLWLFAHHRPSRRRRRIPRIPIGSRRMQTDRNAGSGSCSES